MSDSFSRNVTNGWGSADRGGAYSVTGTAANFAVTGTSGTIVTAANATRAAYLPDVVLRDTDAVVRVAAYKVVNGTATQLEGEKAVTGLTPSANAYVWLRVQAVGSNPTTLRIRAWADGTAEPTNWHYSVADTSTALQTSGMVGLQTYLSSSATNAPVTFSFDDFSVSPPSP
jgi:hypothetical protein